MTTLRSAFLLKMCFVGPFFWGGDPPLPILKRTLSHTFWSHLFQPHHWAPKYRKFEPNWWAQIGLISWGGGISGQGFGVPMQTSLFSCKLPFMAYKRSELKWGWGCEYGKSTLKWTAELKENASARKNPLGVFRRIRWNYLIPMLLCPRFVFGWDPRLGGCDCVAFKIGSHGGWQCDPGRNVSPCI